MRMGISNPFSAAPRGLGFFSPHVEHVYAMRTPSLLTLLAVLMMTLMNIQFIHIYHSANVIVSIFNGNFKCSIGCVKYITCIYILSGRFLSLQYRKSHYRYHYKSADRTGRPYRRTNNHEQCKMALLLRMAWEGYNYLHEEMAGESSDGV